MTNHAEKPLEVSVQDVHTRLENQNSRLFLMDCREPPEFEIASIPGAVLFPMSAWNEFDSRKHELEGKQIVVHCHHGMRSMRVASWLRENGYPEAQSMSGGIDAWSQEVDPSIPRY